MKENQRLKDIIKQVESVQSFSESEKSDTEAMLDNPLENEKIDTTRINGGEPTNRNKQKKRL